MKITLHAGDILRGLVDTDGLPETFRVYNLRRYAEGQPYFFIMAWDTGEKILINPCP